MQEWIENQDICLIKSNEVDSLTHAVTLLTNGWERSASTSFGYEALEAVYERFRVPLESANMDCSLVQ